MPVSKRVLTVVILVVLALSLAACVPLPPAQSPTAAPQPEATISGMPNPASQNCIQQGGKLEIETRGDGGQFGVCYFEDNRQCEEWALMRGECPVGGVKVTGYVTEAGRYCAISGGAYDIKPADSNTPKSPSTGVQEAGTCTFKNRSTCDAWDYYNGKCSPSGS